MDVEDASRIGYWTRMAAEDRLLGRGAVEEIAGDGSFGPAKQGRSGSGSGG